MQSIKLWVQRKAVLCTITVKLASMAPIREMQGRRALLSVNFAILTFFFSSCWMRYELCWDPSGRLQKCYCCLQWEQNNFLGSILCIERCQKTQHFTRDMGEVGFVLFSSLNGFEPTSCMYPSSGSAWSSVLKPSAIAVLFAKNEAIRVRIRVSSIDKGNFLGEYNSVFETLFGWLVQSVSAKRDQWREEHWRINSLISPGSPFSWMFSHSTSVSCAFSYY